MEEKYIDNIDNLYEIVLDYYARDVKCVGAVENLVEDTPLYEAIDIAFLEGYDVSQELIDEAEADFDKDYKEIDEYLKGKF